MMFLIPGVIVVLVGLKAVGVAGKYLAAAMTLCWLSCAAPLWSARMPT